jgi:hypothetical protein
MSRWREAADSGGPRLFPKCLAGPVDLEPDASRT